MSSKGPTNDDVENRRAQLRSWIDMHYGGIRARFIEATEVNQGELSGLLSKKSFGEKRARRLEEQANMPAKFLERRSDKQAHVVDSEESRKPSLPAWPFKRVTRAQYTLLTAEQQTHVENTILLMLPRKVVEERKSANGN